MKLTAKKLELLIQEMMGRRFTQEQEQKILGIITKCRNLMLDLQVVQGFFITLPVPWHVGQVRSTVKNPC